MDFQELYAEYIAPIGNGLKIQAGKINTLIGYEGINSWENPNFSRSFMFGLSQAFTTTGIRFTYPLASWGTVAIGLVNGWDNIEDNNRGKTFEWKVDLTPHEKFGIAFFGSYGAEQSNGNAVFGNAATGVCTNGATGCDPTAKRVVVGSIITVKPTANDTLIIEPYYGNESNATANPAVPSRNARWNGLITYFIHDFNNQQEPHALSLRARAEIWEDNGGVRSCVGGNNFNGGTNACARWSPVVLRLLAPVCLMLQPVEEFARPSGKAPSHCNTSRPRHSSRGRNSGMTSQIRMCSSVAVRGSTINRPWHSQSSTCSKCSETEIRVTVTDRSLRGACHEGSNH